MWTIAAEKLGDRQIKYRFFKHTQTLNFKVVLKLWQKDQNFRDFFIEILSNVPFNAFRWETPPIIQATGDRPFEFVVSDSPTLNRAANPRPFQHYLQQPTPDDIAEFWNLGHDAWLVVPNNIHSPENYVHLAVFIRNAPIVQKHALLQRMGSAVQQHLSEKPLWLSTAGGGVAWLHVRLDSFPKYYRYTPYKTFQKS